MGNISNSLALWGILIAQRGRSAWPELVTASLADYEAQAVALARDPQRLGLIRAKLMRNRDTEPLFDTARSTRDLEAAYTAMAKRLHEGLPPASFAVDPAQECAEPVFDPIRPSDITMDCGTTVRADTRID
jgi:hypothetical protein